MRVFCPKCVFVCVFCPKWGEEMGFARPFSHVQIWSPNPSGPSSSSCSLSPLRSSSSSSSASCCCCRRRRRSRETLAHALTSQFCSTTTKKKKNQKNNTSCSQQEQLLVFFYCFENSGCSRFDALKSFFSERKLKCLCFSFFFVFFGFPNDMLLLLVARITRDRKS